MEKLSCTLQFTYRVPHLFLSPLGLTIVLTKMCWKLNPQSGSQTVLLHFACSALLLSLPSLVADIIVGFVEGYFVGHARRGGACYLLSSERGIRRECATPAMIGLILYKVCLSTPLAMQYRLQSMM
ncbi:hypothetical protein CsSME_00008939 [Camellia sinensis var. sinensis]